MSEPEFDDELRQRVRDAWLEIRKRHKVKRYDDCLAIAQVRSTFILHVVHSKWTETEILACFMAMAQNAQLQKKGENDDQEESEKTWCCGSCADRGSAEA